jgi:hypothetical protein
VDDWLEERDSFWRALECECRGALPQTADSGGANKPVDEDEPSPLSAFTHEDPEQLTLPGLPRGFLAYQINAKYGSMDGGGWAGPGERHSGTKCLPPPPPTHRR